ncbi:hypothetical protein RF11_11839 [Thelohanellus kitauei]|uniref:Uncharacterized protein n=1 Tax=Thelohanellus kitauei TaxID=669202 RepID=A0A0C2N8I8_THEKT|nr:hypothetical protein RF11_11839 [Thelohanellus kitauei]
MDEINTIPNNLLTLFDFKMIYKFLDNANLGNGSKGKSTLGPNTSVSDMTFVETGGILYYIRKYYRLDKSGCESKQTDTIDYKLLAGIIFYEWAITGSWDQFIIFSECRPGIAALVSRSEGVVLVGKGASERLLRGAAHGQSEAQVEIRLHRFVHSPVPKNILLCPLCRFMENDFGSPHLTNIILGNSYHRHDLRTVSSDEIYNIDSVISSVSRSEANLGRKVEQPRINTWIEM